MAAERVFLGLGSNVGKRRAHIEGALEALHATPGVEFVRRSKLVSTEPLGGPEQPNYLNGVAELRTTLSPHTLLGVCKALEVAAGRSLPAPRMAPRPLDLDILVHGDRRVDTADLTVPHVALRERDFWLDGLRELDVDPAELLRGLLGDDAPNSRQLRVLGERDAFAALCTAWQQGGCTVGLVPTMGALHEGHASLFRRARNECDRVAATIFVNPIQFGPGEDFERYPRTLEADLAVLAGEGVDAVFTPAPDAVYPEGFCSRVAVGAEAQGMEGGTRPGHFEGVATVVAYLFGLSRPQRAYFGSKDAQQVAVIRRMARDLGFPTEIVECPISRESDGLARSSRNAYLDPADRRVAGVLHRALMAGRAAFEAAGGEATKAVVLAAVNGILATEPRCVTDYVELRRGGDLAELGEGVLHDGRLLIAAWFGGERKTRLIDNLSLVARPEDP